MTQQFYSQLSYYANSGIWQEIKGDLFFSSGSLLRQRSEGNNYTMDEKVF